MAKKQGAKGAGSATEAAALIEGLGEPGFRDHAEEEYALGLAPGAIKWTPQAMPTSIPAGGRRVRFVSGQFSVVSPFDGSFAAAGPIRAEMEDTGTTPIPPVPIIPTLTGFTALPTSIQAGQTLTLSVSLSAPAPAPTPVQITTPWNLSGQVNVPQGSSGAQGQIIVPTSAAVGSATLRATLGTSTREASVQVVAAPTPVPPDPIPPIPIPPGPVPKPPVVEKVINVKDHGAKGDGTTNDLAAVYKALAAAGAGQGVGIWFPAGAYVLQREHINDHGQVDVLNKQGLTFYGEGAGASRLLFGSGEGFNFSPPQPGQTLANAVQDLAIIGGGFGTINAKGRAIQLTGPQAVNVSRVRIERFSYALASERPGGFDDGGHTWAIVAEDVEVLGWAGIALKFSGGETVRRCKLVQVPEWQNNTLGHPLYICNTMNSGTGKFAPVLIEDVEVVGGSGHCWQVYADNARASQGVGVQTRDVTIRRFTARNSLYGPIIASNGLHIDITLEDIQILGVRSNNSPTFVLSGTNAPIRHLRMKNILLDGGGVGGDALTMQSQGAGMLDDCLIENLTVKNHRRGICHSPSGWPATTCRTVVFQNYRAETTPVAVQTPLPPGVAVS